jgi:hypothetical protein
MLENPPLVSEHNFTVAGKCPEKKEGNANKPRCYTQKFLCGR